MQWRSTAGSAQKVGIVLSFLIKECLRGIALVDKVHPARLLMAVAPAPFPGCKSVMRAELMANIMLLAAAVENCRASGMAIRSRREVMGRRKIAAP